MRRGRAPQLRHRALALSLAPRRAAALGATEGRRSCVASLVALHSRAWARHALHRASRRRLQASTPAVRPLPGLHTGTALGTKQRRMVQGDWRPPSVGCDQNCEHCRTLLSAKGGVQDEKESLQQCSRQALRLALGSLTD
eukprot:108937-Pleurochrysis_carterae.AAC.1